MHGNIVHRALTSQNVRHVRNHLTVNRIPINRKKNYSNGKLENDHKKVFDVVIVGGGMVGSSLACALASTGVTKSLKIAVVESQTHSPLHPISDIPDLRVSAISPASVELFKAVGIWERMKAARVTPYTRMEVWDAVGSGAIQFDNAPHSDPLGWVIENRIIQSALWEHMKTFPSISLFCPSQLSHLHLGSEEKFPEISTTTGEVLSCRLLVGADGPNSRVRTLSGTPSTGYSYNQRGVVATVQLSEPSQTAWQRFLPSGPVALLPVGEALASVVWSCGNAPAEELLKMSNENFVTELNKAFKSRIDPGTFGFHFDRYLPELPVPFPKIDQPTPNPPKVIGSLGKRAAFPLRTAISPFYAKSRLALVGDAGHSVHPLAGQGVNIGFGDVTSLANAICQGVERGQDIGGDILLGAWERERQASVLGIMAGIESIKRLFDSQHFPLIFARNIGLSLANQITPLKAQFAGIAQGKAMDTSRLGKP